MSEGSILIVEDDLKMQRLLALHLEARGYKTRAVDNGTDALTLVADDMPDLVLLDLTLPGIHGLEVCRLLREWSSVPIILVTAADMPQTKVSGLELGADDYLTKPFHVDELIARVRAVLRRTQAAVPPPSPVVQLGDLEIDLVAREVRRSDRSVHLTKIEFDLLKELVTHADRVLTYEQLTTAVWGAHYEDVRPVHVHICNLRRKLEPAPTGPRYIVAVPGVGYRLRPRDPSPGLES